jgi:release factor glutamine methyltransferase
MQLIKPVCTVSEALQSSIQLFKQQSIPEPEESALHLLSHALDLRWESGYRELRHVQEKFSTSQSNSEVQTTGSSMQQLAHKYLTSEQSTLYNSLVERRLGHEPIQYIIGKWDFHYLSGLIIRKPMLCPRPETEELVELVLSDVRRLIDERKGYEDSNQGSDRIRILDLGAGTGAIGIALANQYPNDIQVVALDILADAVELSNQNADKFLSPLLNTGKSDCNNGVEELYNARLCAAEDFTNTVHVEKKYYMEFDIVVSNPPYIPSADMKKLSFDVVDHESHKALCGGVEGLDVIRDIIQRLPEWMKGAKSQHRFCWMEVDDSHPKLLEKLLAAGSEESIKYGVEYSECIKDFCGRDRFVKLRVF